MTTSRTSTRKLLLGILLVLGLPAAVVAALAIWVHIANRRPQSGPLNVRVQPEVVFPWQQAHFLITVNGAADSKATVEPLDVVFAIDVSGSMVESIPTMAEAARRAATQLAAFRGRAVRFSLVSFDVPAEIAVPWTEAPAVFYDGLTRMSRRGGENDCHEMFKRVDELLKTSRPGARQAVIFYTDGDLSICAGCSPGPMSYQEIAAAGRDLRNSGVDLFCVSRPGSDVNPVMLEVTGASSRIFTPSDANDLTTNFESLTAALSGAKQSGAQLSNRLDGRYFRAPLEGTHWVRDPTGTLRLDIGVISKIAKTFGHPLSPTAVGLRRVGTEPVRLTYVDDQGRALETRASYRPLILVITWLALFLPLLPWLVWSLLHLPQRRPVRTGRAPLPIRPPLLPTGLPTLPESQSPIVPVPTLFIGLGAGGLEALRAVRADLKQLHLGMGGTEYQFLALDIDQRPADPSRFDDWSEQAVSRVVAPPEIARAADYLPRQGEVPPYLGWFDLPYYTHSAKEDVNLANGSKGDRVLARLALFRWLSDAKSPLADLESAADALSKVPGHTRQIVIVASPDGGVGSGWFTDVARLLRRLTRARQAGVELIPEIIGVLVAAGEPQGVGNRAALRAELESVALTGEFPRRVTINPDHPLLDRQDTESPFDWLVEVREGDAPSTAAQFGALGSLLCQRPVRQAVLRAVGEQKHIPAAVSTAGLHVVSTLVRDHVQADLMLRLLGPDLLLDILPVRGGYQPRSVPPEDVQRALEHWRSRESRGTPFQRLIGLAADPSAGLTAMMELATAAGDIDPRASGEWVAPALRASVNRLMHGGRTTAGARWTRDWQPVLGAAVLRGFADRLGALSAATPAVDAALRSARRWATSTAEGLDRHVRDLVAVAVATAERRRTLATQLEFLHTLNKRRYLDPAIDPKEVEEASRASLEAWLGSADTLSPLRERMFFEVERDGTVVLRSFIKGQHTLTAAEAATALTEISRALASTAPSLRLSSAIGRLPEVDRQRMAVELAGGMLRPDSVLVAVPPHEAPPSRLDDSMDELRAAVPQPADHGPRRDIVADDVSSLRRLAVGSVTSRSSEADRARFVEIAERESERLRFKIQQRYQIRVAPFPVRLRMAAANPARFRLFARAYKGGRIVSREDENGLARWYDVDAQEFLTFGEQSDLSAAAANYVWYGGTVAVDVATAAGDFSALEEWRSGGREMTADVLVLAAIDVADES